MNDQRPRCSESEFGMIQELIEERVRVECTIVEIDEHTWAIHGGIGIDSDVILAEFGNRADAEIAVEQLFASEGRTAGSRRRPVLS